MLHIEANLLLRGISQPAAILNDKFIISEYNNSFNKLLSKEYADYENKSINELFSNLPDLDKLTGYFEREPIYSLDNIGLNNCIDVKFRVNITSVSNDTSKYYLALFEESKECNLGKYKQFFDTSVNSKFVLDAEYFRFIEWNSTAVETFGYNQHQLSKLCIRDLLKDKSINLVTDVGSNESKFIPLLFFITSEGRSFPAEVFMNKIIDDGKILYCCTVRDITKRKEVEDKVKESEERLLTLINSTPDFICIKDAMGKWLLANDASLKIFNLKHNDYLGKTDEELAVLSDNYTDAFAKCTSTDETAWQVGTTNRSDQIITNKDGKHTIYDVIKVPIFNPDGSRKKLVVIGRDITQNRLLEDKIQKAANDIKTLYENVPVGLYRATVDGKPIFANNALLEILGFNSYEEFSSINMTDLYVNPEYRKRLLELSIDKDHVRGFETEFFTVRKEIIVVRMNVHIKRDNYGDIQYLEGVFEDITKKKISEKVLLEAKEEAEKSEKLKSEFLAQMSHEIRTPINSLLNSIGLIKEELQRTINDEIDSCFSIIDRSSHRIIRTIDSILNMSEIQTGTYEFKRRSIDLMELVIDPVCFEYNAVAKIKNLNFELNILTADTSISADEYSLKQVFINLIDNAVKFTDEGGVTINVYRDENNLLIVEVKDTGVGISEEYLPNLFKPFSQEEQGYTRKYEGNGLGLALVSKFCEFNKATISVSSEKGIGTMFKVYLNQ